MYGRLLAARGALATGEVIEAGRSDLVGQYLGATALKTKAVVESALGGVLFIDEAYTLARTFGANSDLGLEAIDELVRLMENHRDDLVVIVAGYTTEMTEFMDINPGLRSRFSRTIEFPAYNADDLAKIIELQAKNHHYQWSDERSPRSPSGSTASRTPAPSATPATLVRCSSRPSNDRPPAWPTTRAPRLPSSSNSPSPTCPKARRQAFRWLRCFPYIGGL
nr:AAA family ATPase [Fodinicola feengrottensis]